MTTKKRENANDWKVIFSFEGETSTTFAKHELLLRVKFSEAVKRHWKESALMRFDEAERLDASTWYGKTYTSSGKLLEYKVIWRVDLIKQAAARLGALGGAAGRGKSKRRGNSEYYKRLRAKQNKRKS